MAQILAMIVKYLPAILALKDVTAVFKEEQGTDKPWYISRRFWGVFLTGLGVVAGLFFGVKLSPEVVNSLADAVVAFITIGITIYGIVMAAKGTIDKSKEVK